MSNWSDTAVGLLPDFVPMAVAIVGIIMSYKQPERQNRLRTTLILILTGLSGTLVIAWARHWTEARQAVEQANKDKRMKESFHNDLQAQLSLQKNDLLSSLKAQAKTPSERAFINRIAGAASEEDRDGTRITVTVGPSPEPTYPYQTRFILTNYNRHTMLGTVYHCEPQKTDMNKILPGLQQSVIQQDVVGGPIGDLAPGDSFSINCESPMAFWLNNVESPSLKIWIEYKYGKEPMKRGFAFLGLRNPDTKAYSWVPRGKAKAGEP